MGDPSLPFGLRTVDGTCNNLLPGQAKFGAADELFPRMLTPEFQASSPRRGTDTYTQTAGTVVDSQPRTGQQPDRRPDGRATRPPSRRPAPGAEPGRRRTRCFIPNVAPDVGLSAPFNSWFTFFGQFFDHGLDLVTRAATARSFVPLQPDDPLYVSRQPDATSWC